MPVTVQYAATCDATCIWQIITKAVLATCMPVIMQYMQQPVCYQLGNLHETQQLVSNQHAIQLIYGSINTRDLHASNSPLSVAGSVIVQGSIYKYI